MPICQPSHVAATREFINQFVSFILVLFQMDRYYSRPRALYTGPSSWRLILLFTLLSRWSSATLTSEMYLNGTTPALISGSSSFPPTSLQNYHLGFSFRTCRQLLNQNSATLLSQVRTTPRCTRDPYEPPHGKVYCCSVPFVYPPFTRPIRRD